MQILHKFKMFWGDSVSKVLFYPLPLSFLTLFTYKHLLLKSNNSAELGLNYIEYTAAKPSANGHIVHKHHRDYCVINMLLLLNIL